MCAFIKLGFFLFSIFGTVARKVPERIEEKTTEVIFMHTAPKIALHVTEKPFCLFALIFIRMNKYVLRLLFLR